MNVIPVDKVPTRDAIDMLKASGFTPQVIRPPSEREREQDQSTVIVCPTRRTKFCAECGASTADAGEKCSCGAVIGGKIDFQVLDSWLGLVAPMNQKREGPIFALEHRYGKNDRAETTGTGYADVDAARPSKTEEQLVQRDGPLLAIGYEVGKAYNALIEGILASPGLKEHKYILTVEDDNILPWDAQLKLLETIQFARTEDGKTYDAVSGLYHTKEDAHIPLAFGDAAEYRKTGKISYRPIDLSAYPEDQRVIECLGIPMGCTLWRMSLFRELPPPWFVTKESTLRNRRDATTQDLYFSLRCVQAGKRLALARDVYVGHKGSDGVVY